MSSLGYRIVSLRQLQMFQTLAHLCLRTLVCPIKPMKGNLAVRGLYRHIDNIGGKTAGVDMTGSGVLLNLIYSIFGALLHIPDIET